MFIPQVFGAIALLATPIVLAEESEDLPLPTGLGDERTVYRRIEPLEARWGEIQIIDGGSIELQRFPGESPQEFPRTSAIVCTERSRVERESAEAPPPAAPSRRVGALYLAARVDGDDDAWSTAVDQLAQRASTLGPENFGEFLTQFPQILRDEIPTMSLGYRVAYCATHRDRTDVAGSVGRRVVEGETRWVAGTLGTQTPYCPPLASRLEDGPARITYATRLVVGRAKEQELRVRDGELSGSGPATWPEGASVRSRAAPEGASGFSSRGADGEGMVAEYFRPGRPDGQEGGEARVVRARTQPASMPIELLETGARALRWTWSERERALGPGPRDLRGESGTLDVALFFPTPHGHLDLEGHVRAATRRFDTAGRAPGIATLASILEQGLIDLGPDEMFAVFCQDGAWDRARYCVGPSCSPVLNGVSFCSALETRLSR